MNLKTIHRPDVCMQAHVIFLVLIVLTATACAVGCGGGAGSVTVPPPPPPPPAINVTLTPPSGSILLGNSQTWIATVTNTTDTAVNWSVNGVAGGTASSGTITTGGVYTAPGDLPSPSTVQVTATSQADPTKSATSQLTITSDIAISIAPPNASVELGATQAFHAAITSAGHPDTSVRWALSGAACPAACGSVDLSGNYTAPAILPSTATATLTAQSVADPSKQATAPISITSNFTLQVTAPQTVPAGGTATIVVTMTPVPGSNPSTVLSWSLSGPGCSSATCGTLTVVTTQGSGGTVTAGTATYTAPGTAPNPDSVTVTVTPQADPTKKAQASLAVQAGVNVSLSPSTDTLAVNHRVTLTAQVFGTTNTGLSWSVSGVSGGNTTLGQICVVASSPCQSVTSGTALQVDYVAPGAIPQPNPVSIEATSAADAAITATSQVTVINHALVSVQPESITLAPLSVEGFTATVLGTSNQSVVWQVQGTACANAGVCGSIDANGNYTAPGSAPSPDALQVVAVSSDDPTQSGVANVTISTGSNILTLLPASVYAGAADGFTLLVEGSGFTASSPGPGSTLLVAGTARTTICLTSTACSAPVTAADVSVAGNVSVQIQNPGGTESNAVSLVVAPPNASNDVIALSSASPSATGMDIVVVDPTTAGVSAQGNDVDLNVAALGLFSVASNSCSLAGNPVPLLRPASGSATFNLCVFSESGLDTSMTYTVSGPGDVTVLASQPAGLGIIELTLQVPASALPGARTLLIQNTNLDETAASGALVIQ
ncbi:MAG TPA: hypothetical protein VJW94_15635 [Candidatus Acidoferrum sp.]|nr:hypothetical protein [Candidatus Acidoferrum sp.]